MIKDIALIGLALFVGYNICCYIYRDKINTECYAEKAYKLGYSYGYEAGSNGWEPSP